jgi:hypothetical protein
MPPRWFLPDQFSSKLHFNFDSGNSMASQIDDNPIGETDESASPIQYRSVCVLAIFSAAAAAFSILTVFHPVFWIIPLAAIAFGYYALKQIQRAPTEYTGQGIALAGIVAAILLGLVGHFIHSYIQRHSVPTGYKLVKWDDLQPNPDDPAEIIPKSAYELEPNDDDRDRRIFITGFINLNMTNRTINIKQFVMVPTAGHCNFCQSNIKSTDMILVNFTGDLSINATGGEIKIGGKFKIDRDQAANPFGGLPYQLEADYLQE